MSLSSQQFRHLCNLTTHLLKDRESLYSFIKTGKHNLPRTSCIVQDFVPLTIDELYKTRFTSTSSINVLSAVHIDSLEHLINPRPYDKSFYPLNPNKSDFVQDRPYNYLATFSVRSFESYLRTLDPTSIEHKVALEVGLLLESFQFQTRGGDLWRNLATVLLSLDIERGTQNYFIRQLLFVLLRPYASFPVYQRQNRLVFSTDQADMVSIFPFLVYMISSLGVDILCGNLDECGVVVAWNNYSFYAKGSLLDNYLIYKSALTSWLSTKISQLSNISVPVFSLYGHLIGKKVISCDRDKILKEFQNDKLPDYPVACVREYLSKNITSATTSEQVRQCLIAARLISNTRLFLATSLDLGKEAGSGARTEGQNILGPTASRVTEDGKTVSLELPDSEGPLMNMLNYLRSFLSVISVNLRTINMSQKFIDMLTTNSSGTKADARSLSRLTQSASKKRVVNAAINASTYNSEESILCLSLSFTKTGVRFQIARRARQIFIISNEEFMINIPIYVILELFTAANRFAHLGKQQGGMTDFVSGMSTTTMHILHSYSDVSGMDASYQRSLQQTLYIFLLEAARESTADAYGPFRTKLTVIRDIKTGEYTEEVLSAIWQCVSETASRRVSPIAYTSNIFGEQKMENQAFGSGLASTSVNHTVTIIGGVKGEDYAQKRTHRVALHVLGDDLLTLYMPAPDYSNVLSLLENDVHTLKRLGFKLETDASFYTSELLQQRVILGTYAPYPDRISLMTAERANFKSTPKERCDEDFQLMSDLANRSNRIELLPLFSFIRGLVTARRLTLTCPKSRVPNLQSFLPGTVGAACDVTVLPSLSEKSPNVIVQIILPASWLLLTDGGELPHPSLQSDDGSYIAPRSIYAPRGKYSDAVLYRLAHSTRDINHPTLAHYEFGAASILRHINFTLFRERVRDEKIDAYEVQQLTKQLQTMGDTGAVERSRRAYEKLVKANIPIGKNIVYAFQLERKIYDALRGLDIDRHEIIEMPDSFIRLLHTRVGPINETSSMKVHRFNITELDGITANFRYPFLTDIAIQPNAYPYSPVWTALQVLGIMTTDGVNQVSTLSAVTGKYGVFKVGDSKFRTLLALYRKYPEFLEDVFIAMNLSPSARQIYIRSFEAYTNSRDTMVEFTITNRQLMILSPNFREMVDVVSSTTDKAKIAHRHGPLFLSAIAYTWILSNMEWYLGHQLLVEPWDNLGEVY